MIDIVNFVLLDGLVESDENLSQPTSSWNRSRKYNERGFERLELARALPYLCVLGLKEIAEHSLSIMETIETFLIHSRSETPSHYFLVATYFHLLVEQFPDNSDKIVSNVGRLMPTIISLFSNTHSKDSRAVSPMKSNLLYIIRFYLLSTFIFMQTRDQVSLEHSFNVTQLLDVIQAEIKRGRAPQQLSSELFISLFDHSHITSTQVLLPLHQYLCEGYQHLNITEMDVYAWAYYEVYSDLLVHKLLLADFRPPSTDDSPDGSRKRQKNLGFDAEICTFLASAEQERNAIIQALTLAISKYPSTINKKAFWAVISQVRDLLFSTTAEIEWGYLLLATATKVGFLKETSFWEDIVDYFATLVDKRLSDPALFLLGAISHMNIDVTDTLRKCVSDIIWALVNTSSRAVSTALLTFASESFKHTSNSAYYCSDGKMVHVKDMGVWLLSLLAPTANKAISQSDIAFDPELLTSVMTALWSSNSVGTSASKSRAYDTCDIVETRLLEGFIMEQQFCSLRNSSIKVLAIDCLDIRMTDYQKTAASLNQSSLDSETASFISHHLSDILAARVAENPSYPAYTLYLFPLFHQALSTNAIKVIDFQQRLETLLRSVDFETKSLEPILGLLLRCLQTLSHEGFSCDSQKQFFELVKDSLYQFVAKVAVWTGSHLAGKMKKARSDDEFVIIDSKSAISSVFPNALHLEMAFGDIPNQNGATLLRLCCLLVRTIGCIDSQIQDGANILNVPTVVSQLLDDSFTWPCTVFVLCFPILTECLHEYYVTPGTLLMSDK
jgi:hypothetical protein